LDELVSFGMTFWSQEVVEEALGADLAEVLPELLRLSGCRSKCRASRKR
jgi:hypothetical protein